MNTSFISKNLVLFSQYDDLPFVCYISIPVPKYPYDYSAYDHAKVIQITD